MENYSISSRNSSQEEINQYILCKENENENLYINTSNGLSINSSETILPEFKFKLILNPNVKPFTPNTTLHNTAINPFTLHEYVCNSTNNGNIKEFDLFKILAEIWTKNANQIIIACINHCGKNLLVEI